MRKSLFICKKNFLLDLIVACMRDFLDVTIAFFFKFETLLVVISWRVF